MRKSSSPVELNVANIILAIAVLIAVVARPSTSARCRFKRAHPVCASKPGDATAGGEWAQPARRRRVALLERSHARQGPAAGEQAVQSRADLIYPFISRLRGVRDRRSAGAVYAGGRARAP